MKQYGRGHHMLYLGRAAIRVQDTAFQHGYQRFQQTHTRQELDEKAIHKFISSNITNTMASDQENAGYITGWFAALLRQQDRSNQAQEIYAEPPASDHRSRKPEDDRRQLRDRRG